ncbi:MAG: carbonic anhydrase [Anaerolineae bacterium]|nr:carbonic anhydrase [Anaerolineae bacterium]
MATINQQQLTGDEALTRLTDGNARYVQAQMEHPRRGIERRQELVGGQSPFALVLGCADSRVSPTVLFDQGLGDLFVIRVAGNVLDTTVLASIEYAAAFLAVPLIVVLGHSNCGAVGAAVAGKPVPGHLPDLVSIIQPAVDQVQDGGGDILNNAIQANARRVADELAASQPVLADLVQAGTLKIVAAEYYLDDGRVEWLDK